MLDIPPNVDHDLLQAIRIVIKQELQIQPLDAKVTTALSELKKLKETVDDLVKSQTDHAAREEAIRKDFFPMVNKKMNEISEALTMHVIDIDNHSRKWSLIIQGLKGEAHEHQSDTRKACLQLARDTLGLPRAMETPIAACHRLKQVADAPIIVRFCDLDDRDRWLSNAKKLRNNVRKISISPDLSPAVRPIKKDLMEKRRNRPDDMKKKSVIKYKKTWPYAELYVDGRRHCETSISKSNVVKNYTNVDLNLTFDFTQ